MSEHERRGGTGGGEANASRRSASGPAPGRQSLTSQIVQLRAAITRDADDAGGPPIPYLAAPPVATAAQDGADPFALHVQCQEAGPRSTTSDETHAVAAAGVKSGGGALPHADRIAASFGRHADAVHGIRAHVGGDAAAASAAIGAEAYTTGNSIAFSREPDLELAAHEAAHVVQQAGGVQLRGGVGQAGDAYEQHADAVAREVVAGRSAEALLDKMAGDPGSRTRAEDAVQRRDVPTHFGTFKSTTFAKTAHGVDAVIEFHPDPAKVDAKKLGLSQTAKITYAGGTHTGIDPTKEGRRVTSGPGQDFVLDRISSRNNPIYGASNLGANQGLGDTAQDNNTSAKPTQVGPRASGGNATYQLGHSYRDATGQHTKEASLYDSPGGGANTFETTALGLEGRDQGEYFGSVSWGYEIVNGAVVEHDIALASMGVPTQNYLAPARLWNSTRTRGTLEVTANPAHAKAQNMSAVDVPRGTRGTQNGEYLINNEPWVEFIASTGGTTYYIRVVDLRDVQDGGETVDVPVPEVFVNAAPLGIFRDMQMRTRIKELPANTRMENTSCTIHGSYGMKIVDGPDIGLTGYVDQTLIRRERQ